LTCEGRASLPVVVETLTGFTGAEDFAFDAEGRYVAVDDHGDLVRIARNGDREVWVPGLGADTAGTRFLPGGDLLVAQVGTGTLRRITPAGDVLTLLTGLEYPNGMNGGRVRQIDPDTGDFAVVGVGLYNPNGVAVGHDGQAVFIGSFGGGRIYRIDLTGATEPGVVTVFARTPGAPDVPDPDPPCRGLDAGDACTTTLGTSGTCYLFGGVLDCFAPDPCGGKGVGDACVDTWGTPGVCQDQSGALVCGSPPPCHGLETGDPCAHPSGQQGVCGLVGNVLTCLDPACVGRSAGAACTDPWGAAGTCEDQGAAGLACVPRPPCQGLPAGASCTTSWGTPGECKAQGAGLACHETACLGRDSGDACTDAWGSAGTCVVWDGLRYCQPPYPCDGGAVDDACETYDLMPGVCVEQWGYLTCVPRPGCVGLDREATCVDAKGIYGHCATADATDGCAADDFCAGIAVGEPCALDYQVAGACTEDASGLVTCVPNDPCAGRVDGDPCVGLWGVDGICTDWTGQVTCETFLDAFFAACEDLALLEPCTAYAWGEAYPGRCIDGPGQLFCNWEPDPEAACAGRVAGDGCLIDSPWYGPLEGICRDDGTGTLACETTGSGQRGGLDGLAVDGCGHVFVTEYVLGKVWHITPDGQVVEEAAQLESFWIPNLHWGPGAGGFDALTLYVADRDQGRLFGLAVGVPGAPEAYP
jgi:hypothetical protein